MVETDYARLCCASCLKPLSTAAVSQRRKLCSTCSDIRRSPTEFVCAGCYRATSRRVRGGSADAGMYCSRECAFRNIAAIGREIAFIRRMGPNARRWARRLEHRQARVSAERERALVRVACLECRSLFAPKHGNQLQCSDACRSKRIERQRAKSRKAWLLTPAGKAAKRVSRKAGKMAKRSALVERFDDLEVLKRDGWRCQICGIATPERLRGTYKPNAPEVDHIVAISRGGKHERANVQCACRRCNGLKSDGPASGQMPLLGAGPFSVDSVPPTTGRANRFNQLAENAMKKSQAGSAEAAIEAAVNAAKGLPKPPAHVRLRPADLPFWDGIVRARARDEWTEVDLVVAGQLARCQRDIEAESEALETEGTVLKNDRGTMVANPRVSVLEQLARREMALMRSLQMGGRALADPRQKQAQRKVQRNADKIHAELEEDALLA